MPSLTIGISYNTVSEAKLMNVKEVSIWLYNQSSSSKCLCQALAYEQPLIIAFNFFSSNKTCQLISNNFSSSTTFYIASWSNSTIFILKNTLFDHLKSICCGDLSWLLNKIQDPSTFHQANVTLPVGLALDTDLDTLLVAYGSRKSLQLRDTTGNMTGRKSLFAKTDARPITYHDELYFIGLNPSTTATTYYFYVYNQTLSRMIDLPFPEGEPQRAVWLFDNSIMCVILQQDQSSILVFVNWLGISSNLTYNRTIPVPFNNPYALTKSNDDSMIYVSGDNATIYQLSTSTLTWSVLVSNTNSTEVPVTLFVDSCGTRLWALMLGFGIRIYDRINGNELASWNMSTTYPTLYDMVLTSTYELYLIDYSMNRLVRYGSSLNTRCTIN